ALDKWVQELMNGNWLSALIALLKVVSLEHASDCGTGRQFYQSGGAKLIHPLTIEANFSFFCIENFKYLFFISLSIGQYIIPGEWFSGHIFTRRITYHAGKITNQENHFMAHILKDF